VLRQEATSQQAAIVFESIDTLALAACSHLMQRHIIPTFPLPTTAPPVHLPGRMEQIEHDGKTLLIDGAHTPGSARRLLGTIDTNCHRFICPLDYRHAARQIGSRLPRRI